MKLSLAEHIKRSREAVAANKAKGNKHAELLANMYAQPSRFIEEILQNTEDAYARKKPAELNCSVRFKLFTDKVEIHHNGKDFDENDLMSVTTFANTTKKNNSEVNLIGKFGIGFKSVFSITEFPEIHCSSYHFRIEDYEVLTACRPLKADAGFSTLIVLPFKRKSVEECYAVVKQGLLELNACHLLFLKKLNRIEVFENSNMLCCIERITSRLMKNMEKRVILKKNYFPDSSEEQEIFLVHLYEGRKAIQMPELAFKVQEREETYYFEPVYNSPLCVYFPLKMYTGLNFILHAPFTTNPLRDFALFDPKNCPENIAMLRDAVRSFVMALSACKKNGLYSIAFLSGLFNLNDLKDNSDKQQSLISGSFFHALKEFLRTDSNMPLGKNKFGKIRDVLIPEDESIYRLLGEPDLIILFQKRFFIDPVVSSDVMADFRKFLTDEMNLKIVDAESFGFRLRVSAGFIEGKSFRWIRELYKYLHSRQKLWDVQHADLYYSIRTMPLILTDNFSWEAAYDENQEPKVFLPDGKRDLLPVVHHKLFADEFCAAFIKALGIKKPDAFAQTVYNIIPQFENMRHENRMKYLSMLETILTAYSEASINQKNFLTELLKNTAWVYAEDELGNISLYKPGSVYFKNEWLNAYFNSNPTVRFLNAGILKKLNERFPDLAVNFLSDMGVADTPRVEYAIDYSPIIDGFDHFIRFIDIKRSRAFANILISASEDQFQKEVLQWVSKQRWIYHRGEFVAPETISLSQISEKYWLDEAEKNKLGIMLGIWPENKAGRDQQLHWQPRVRPEEINLTAIRNTDLPDMPLQGAISVMNALQTSLPLFETGDRDMKEYSAAELEEMHKWSCEVVLRLLHGEFPMPEFTIETSGCADFRITKNGEVLHYVFISTKTDLMKGFHIPAGMFINMLKSCGSPETLLLYCVGGAGTQFVSIQKISDPGTWFISEKVSIRGNIFFRF